MDLLSIYISTSSENAEAVSITSNLQEGKGPEHRKAAGKGEHENRWKLEIPLNQNEGENIQAP